MIGTWLLLQLGVLLVTIGAWAALRLAPFDASRIQRLLLLCAPLVLVGASVGPVERPFQPAAQVYEDGTGGPAVVIAGSTVSTPIPASTSLAPLLAVFFLLPLPPILGVLMTLRGAHSLRRIGRVEILLAPKARAPFALWLGRPLVVLDPDTALDAALAEIAIRHELQHHRQGDPLWAWALVLLRALSPIAVLLRPLFAAAEEIRCDRALTRHVPVPQYAEALFRLATRPTPTPLAAGLGGPPLRWRLTMLIRPAPRSPLRTLTAVLLVPLLALGAAPLGWAADGLVVDAPEIVSGADALEAAGFYGAHHPRVLAALDRSRSTPARRAWIEASLKRSVALRPVVEARLAAAGLPTVLSAVPLVESGYQNLRAESLSPKVPEHQRGAGYWMFIATTARKYGLRVDTVDERLDFEKETAAAIALLRDNYARYGDWALALAAYNQGERAVDDALAKGGTRDAFALTDMGLLNDYVDQVYAAALLMQAQGTVP